MISLIAPENTSIPSSSTQKASLSSSLSVSVKPSSKVDKIDVFYPQHKFLFPSSASFWGVEEWLYFEMDRRTAALISAAKSAITGALSDRVGGMFLVEQKRFMDVISSLLSCVKRK